jgi:hypothetical protein
VNCANSPLPDQLKSPVGGRQGTPAYHAEAAAGLSPTGVRHQAKDSAVQVTERSVIH